jgi:hypothetical protein
MPDTGAPWNIPFAAPADLVRDWPDLSEDVALAVASGLSAAGNPGIGSNVVQTVKTDVFSTSSATYTAITGMTVTITPSSNTSKVLLICQVTLGHSVNGGFLRLAGGNVSYVGDAAGTRVQATSGQGIGNNSSFLTTTLSGSHTIVYLDSPATTSPTTYTLEGRISTGAILYIGRTDVDGDAVTAGRYPASFTAIEVAP